MTPDEIHRYGLSEVTRITAQMDTVLRSIGLSDGTVGERMDALMGDPRFLYRNDNVGREAMLVRYGQILGRVRALLPKYFAHLPAIPLTVRRVPPFSEKGAPGAYYEPPGLAGGRPGTFFANLRNVGETPMWAMPTLAYHEGIPGHHMQIATALEIRDLPLRRRMEYLPAFGEGWALYAEHLAKDMGLYDGDPYGDLGRLQAELFRAVRLVVDTGMHAKHWSREQAIDYMQSTTGMAQSDVTAEIERYVVWPGQACAYKIGMKTILELREKAQNSLGKRFDLREFHAVILENGAMPLWLLQKNVDRWIEQKRGLSGRGRLGMFCSFACPLGRRYLNSAPLAYARGRELSFMRSTIIAWLAIACAAACTAATAGERAVPSQMELAYFQKSSIFHSGLRDAHTIALTFDDGPNAYTANVLDVLKANNVKGTFFIVGKMAHSHPAIAGADCRRRAFARQPQRYPSRADQPLRQRSAIADLPAAGCA